MISREQYDALPTEVRARIEISECSVLLSRLKWWQTRKRKALISHIRLVRDCHINKPLTYFSFLDSK